MKTQTLESHVEIDGVEVMTEVEYTAEWYRGWKAKRIDGWLQEEPDEPAGWQIEIEAVRAKGIDLLPLLEDSDVWMDQMRMVIADELNATQECCA